MDTKSNYFRRLFFGGLAVAVAIFLGVTIMFNRSQPSEREFAVAKELIAEAKGEITLSEEQRILYEVGRNTVTINAYGLLDQGVQDRVLGRLKSALTRIQFEGRVYINFFPPRDAIEVSRADGVKVTEVKKSSPIRQHQIR